MGEDACHQDPETEATTVDHHRRNMSEDIGEVPEGTMTEMLVPHHGRNEGQVHLVIVEDPQHEVRDITGVATEPETDILVAVRGATERIDTGMIEIDNLVSEMVP